MSENKLPNKTLQLYTVFRYELLRNLRGKKIFGILAITVTVALFFIGIFEFAASQGMEIDSIILSVSITFVFFLTVLMGAFFGSGAIVSEFHDKTGSILFTNPVSKSSIWLGKFVSSEIISIGVGRPHRGVLGCLWKERGHDRAGDNVRVTREIESRKPRRH